MSRAGHWDRRVLTYLTLRTAVGYLGIALPFALAAGNWLIFSGSLQQSVSDYFYTGMRGVLVGGLCVIGAFLLAYHGDDRWDSLLAKAAGIGAVGVALFPTPPPRPSFREAIAGYCHYGFGGLMFTSLVAIALWWPFRRAASESRYGRLRRLPTRVCLACGIVMLVALALTGLVSLPFAASLSSLDPVFWLETAAITAFGVSWLVKGQAIVQAGRPRPAIS